MFESQSPLRFCIWISTPPFHSSFKTALEPAGADYQKYPVVGW